jgi:hypothetical protein
MVDAAVDVFTFRRGLLSRFGHDLLLSFRKVVIELAATKVSVQLDLRSLEVRGAVGERKALQPLSDHDKAQIEQAMRDRVLEVATHAQARFSGELSQLSAARFRVAGELALHGRSAGVQIDLDVSDRIRGRVELAPSRWGIEPYSALGGGLKLADRVQVAVDLSKSAQGFATEQWQSARCTWRS